MSEDNKEITISYFLKKINEIKFYCDSYLILTIFMKIIRFIYENKYNRIDKNCRFIEIKEIIKDSKERKYLDNTIDKKCVDKCIELLDIFTEKICQKAYISIYIQKEFSDNKNFLVKEQLKNEKYINRINEIKINDIKTPFIRDIMIFTKALIEIYNDLKKYCTAKENIQIKIINLDYKSEEDIKDLMEKIENIYTDLIKEYRYEIVLRASSKKNHDKTIEREIPSLFYEKKLIASEKEIFHDFIAAKPNEFENMTTFDKLTKMRHYEVSNRLLDVTYDPLLALYFACGEKKDNRLEKIENIIKDKEGNEDNEEIKQTIREINNIVKSKEENYSGSKTIFIYAVKEKYIKYFDSDTVTILSILSKLKNKDKVILKIIVDFFKKVKIDDKISFKTCRELTDTISTYFPNIEIRDKIEIYIENLNKKEFRKNISLYDLYDLYKDSIEISKFINIACGLAHLKKIKTKSKKFEYLNNMYIKDVLKKSPESYILEFCLKKIDIGFEQIDYIGSNLNDIEKEQLKDIKKNLKISINSEIFDRNELFNFYVSKCVAELSWQLKQEIPGWYDNILQLDTFIHCFLVKPKMNNPRIVSQSGAFFIYPFEDTSIKDSLLETDDKKIVFKIYDEKIVGIKEELDTLNIRETKYMPDDLTVYAEEIREKYKNA